MEANKKHEYFDKNDQSPSYCDRVLVRNNMPTTAVKAVSYEAYHELFGSDHRPVVLTLDLDLPRYTFCDLTLPHKIGIISIDLLRISHVNISDLLAKAALKPTKVT